MQTDYLREFLDLSDTLNFTQSARRLNISQSTLSRHIMAIEEEVGAPLFSRSADAVHLTRAGQVFYAEARSVVKGLDDMMERAERAGHENVVTLKVSGSTIQPALNRFMSRMSARAAAQNLPVRFEYSHARTVSGEQPPSSAIELLDGGEVDFLVEYFPLGSEALTRNACFRLCSEPLVAFASSDNPLVQRHDLKLSDLSGMSFVLFSVYQHCPTLYESVIRAGGCVPKQVRTVLVSDLLEIPEYLEQLGPNEINTIQTNLVALHGLGDDVLGRVKRLDLKDPSAIVTFYVMWRRYDNRPALTMAIDLAREVKQSFITNPMPESYQFTRPTWED